jgi:dephospho-CoA kinase
MIKVAITGNIACGKTKTENYLKEFYPVIDTDNLAHNILISHKNEIIKAFEGYDILENNEICRKKLGNIVFQNTKLRKKLENIMHPKIKNDIQKFFNSNLNAKACFVGIPLIFEANMENLFDKIILVYSDDTIRLERLIKRNNLTKEQAMLRINSQMPQQEKINKSDYILTNNTDLQTLYFQIDKILQTMLF